MEKIRLEINCRGDKKYYKWDTDELHNPYGPAVECADVYKAWWINGKRHRENGPAIEFVNGTKSWYVNNKLHREDGPAVEDANGSKSWYLNGVELTEAEFNSRHSSCIGKVVEIDGKRYKLEEV